MGGGGGEGTVVNLTFCDFENYFILLRPFELFISFIFQIFALL